MTEPHQDPALPILLTTKEVCGILKIDRTTLYALEIRGKFPVAMRIGQQKRWRLRDIEAFIDEGVQAEAKRRPGCAERVSR